jgi:hypothetical protein
MPTLTGSGPMTGLAGHGSIRSGCGRAEKPAKEAKYYDRQRGVISQPYGTYAVLQNLCIS